MVRGYRGYASPHFISLLIVLLVEFLFDDSAGESLLADLHFDAVSHLDGGIYQSDSTALFGRDEAVACGDFPYFLAVLEYLVAMAWDGIAFQLDAAQTPGDTLRLLTQERLLADEFLFVELHEH